MNKKEKYITSVQRDWRREVKELEPGDIITVSFCEELRKKDLVLVLDNGASIIDYYHSTSARNVYKISDAYKLIPAPAADPQSEIYLNYIYTLEDAVRYVELRENNRRHYYKWKMFHKDTIGRDIMSLQHAARKLESLPALISLIKDNINYLEGVNSSYLYSRVVNGLKS